MAQNFFDTYQQAAERRKKQQPGLALAEPLTEPKTSELFPKQDTAFAKQQLRGQPQFRQQSPLAGGALEGYQTFFDPIMAPLTGESKLMTTPSGEFGGLDQWKKQIGQGARVATGAVDTLAPTAQYIMHGDTPQPTTTAATTPQPVAPTVTSTGGGATMTKPLGAVPGSQVGVQSSPIPNLPAGAKGWEGTPGWGPKMNAQQFTDWEKKAQASAPPTTEQLEAGMPTPFQAPAAEAPMDARSMGLGPTQQTAFDQIAQGNSAHATEAAYNRWLQMQGLGQAQKTQQMNLATGESGLEDAALRRSMLRQEGTGNTPGQQLERSKAATEMLRYMPTMVQDATGKMVPNPERTQLERIALEGLGGTASTAAPATTAPTPGQADASQPTSFWDKAHAFGRQAVPAGLAAAAPGVLAKMGVKSAGRGVLGPLAYGGLAYSGLNMLADALDPEGTKAVGRNPKSGFAGAVAGGVGGYKFGPRPGVATPTEAGPSATPALNELPQRPAGWEYETPRQPGWEYEGSAMSPATAEPVRQGFGQYVTGTPPTAQASALKTSDAAMKQRFQNAPAMEAAPVVYTPEDLQAIQAVREGMSVALKTGDMTTFQKLWAQMEQLHNKYKGHSPSGQ